MLHAGAKKANELDDLHELTQLPLVFGGNEASKHVQRGRRDDVKLAWLAGVAISVDG